MVFFNLGDIRKLDWGFLSGGFATNVGVTECFNGGHGLLSSFLSFLFFLTHVTKKVFHLYGINLDHVIRRKRGAETRPVKNH